MLGVPSVDALRLMCSQPSGEMCFSGASGMFRPACLKCTTSRSRQTVFQCTVALTTRLRPKARNAWLSNERSRISPRSWRNTARLSLCSASPLLRPARRQPIFRPCAPLCRARQGRRRRSARPPQGLVRQGFAPRARRAAASPAGARGWSKAGSGGRLIAARMQHDGAFGN